MLGKFFFLFDRMGERFWLVGSMTADVQRLQACAVRKNKKTASIILHHFQGILLTHNTTARVIRSNQSLVLQKINRHSAGNYACSAINAEGETVSNQLPLRVKCKYFLL